MLQARVTHFLGAFHVHPVNTQGRRQVYRPRNERHLRSGIGSGARHRKTHLPGTAITDKPHGVDRFTRGTSRDKYPQTLQSAAVPGPH